MGNRATRAQVLNFLDHIPWGYIVSLRDCVCGRCTHYAWFYFGAQGEDWGAFIVRDQITGNWNRVGDAYVMKLDPYRLTLVLNDPQGRKLEIRVPDRREDLLAFDLISAGFLPTHTYLHAHLDDRDHGC